MPPAPGSYRALLGRAGIRPLWVWVAVARLQYGALGLGLLLLVSTRRHSYADAGLALAVFGLAGGVLAPRRGRLVDRAGARRASVGLGVAFALALGVLTAVAGAPLPVLLVVAAGAGCLPPPVGPVMRAAWRRSCGQDEAMLRRAYALDATGEEILFVVGPVLAAAAITGVGAPVVVLTAVGLLLASVTGMAWCLPRGAAAGGGARPAGRAARALWRDRGFRSGLAPVAALGLLLGGVEVAGVAAAVTAAGSSWAGVPAAAVSAGSVAGGLLFGRRRWPGSARTQARVLALAAAGLVAGAALAAPLLPVLIGVLALAGLCVAPAVVCCYLVADQTAGTPSAGAVAGGGAPPGPDRAVEAGASVNAAFNMALSLGTALSGVLVDAASPRVALLAGAGVAAVAAAPPRRARA